MINKRMIGAGVAVLDNMKPPFTKGSVVREIYREMHKFSRVPSGYYWVLRYPDSTEPEIMHVILDGSDTPFEILSDRLDPPTA